MGFVVWKSRTNLENHPQNGVKSNKTLACKMHVLALVFFVSKFTQTSPQCYSCSHIPKVNCFVLQNLL